MFRRYRYPDRVPFDFAGLGESPGFLCFRKPLIYSSTRLKLRSTLDLWDPRQLDYIIHGIAQNMVSPASKHSGFFIAVIVPVIVPCLYAPKTMREQIRQILASEAHPHQGCFDAPSQIGGRERRTDCSGLNHLFSHHGNPACGGVTEPRKSASEALPGALVYRVSNSKELIPSGFVDVQDGAIQRDMVDPGNVPAAFGIGHDDIEGIQDRHHRSRGQLP
jgi:hypothetical protein